ncbi:MAG: phosphomethylpyrimidine synthase ThiC [Gaiellales bacterium]|nr:MAG: phosphomethylpyrimidine synthase ThiC [Gaiellales bacterium]
MSGSQTLLQRIAAGKEPRRLKEAASASGVGVPQLAESMLAGHVVIPAGNSGRKVETRAIGSGMPTRVNANIGASSMSASLDDELAKLQAAVEAGADAVMDLSSGGDIRAIRSGIAARCALPLGTVPVYEAAVESRERDGSMVAMDAEELLAVVERHAADGVDFMTIHAGLTRSALEELEQQGRLMDVVSRGGAFMIAWMLHHDRENPYYEYYDELLEILARWDVTISIGDGLRPGCIADSGDRAQYQELVTMGRLAARARESGVQSIIEGPGHVPLSEIDASVRTAKKLTEGAPLYVLGPLVTDVAPGYDHVTAAIGGAVAGTAGADFLCYVTAAEHLGLPDRDDVFQGVMVSRIAAHAADIAKGLPGAARWDESMARARKALDWDEQIRLAIDPGRAGRIYNERQSASTEGCSMCAELCAMKVVSDYLGIEAGEIQAC